MAKAAFDHIAKTYDNIAERYREAKKSAHREFVNSHSLFQMTGAVAGKSVLDLGCGMGHYTRRMKQAGAADVLGIDISPEMIRLAEETEAAKPIGCRYMLADAADLNLAETFDLAIAVYVLNYAANKSQLLDICRGIARALTPVGRFAGINVNMFLDPSRYGESRKYGKWLTASPERVEGDAITVHLTTPDGNEVIFDNYYLHPSTYEAAFAEAGLRDFAWVPQSVSRDGIEAYPTGYWDAYLEAPTEIGMVARR